MGSVPRPSNCARNSSPKKRTALATGLYPNWPCPHSEPPRILRPTRSINSISPSRPDPSATRSRISSKWLIPSRHGKHLPHDSI